GGELRMAEPRGVVRDEALDLGDDRMRADAAPADDVDDRLGDRERGDVAQRFDGTRGRRYAIDAEPRERLGPSAVVVEDGEAASGLHEGRGLFGVHGLERVERQDSI